ncbi:ABC transporter substrate-binding protein [uncultured Cohaesibacter sp.]|uniref:ABC transporter substrate-binding protein n=1 Tax=uncultured Cohaesibacter sp. TaxID=1002546 RepID=UPI002931E629|nr:ABC transporter substrate-binding protein [uncultured Cohaesibacter sp.]
MKMKSLLLGVALAAAISVPAVADSPEVIRMATSFKIRSMDPIKQGFWMQEFGQGELLMKFHADGSITPWLAKDLKRVDDTTWVITMRDNITFQNGKAVDVPAVLAAIAYNRELNGGTQSVIPAEAEFLQTGPWEITVKTGTPVPELPSILAHESRLMIIDVDTVKAANGDFEKLEGAGIHTGPFKLISLDDQKMIAERYDNYWQGKPVMKGVELHFVTDENARILAVKNGEIDIALYPPVAAKPVFDVTPGVTLDLGAVSIDGFTGFMNVKKGPMADVAVRKAVMKAVNYQEIADTVFSGTKGKATGLYNPNFSWALKNYEFDLEEANDLLDKAGWVKKGDYREKDGKPLSITMLIYPQQPDLKPLSSALQGYFKAVGINSKITSVDSVNETAKNDLVDWDFALSSTGTATVGAVGNFLVRYIHTGGDRNYGYSNANVDQLIDELNVTMDQKKRDELLGKIQTVLVEDDPYAFVLALHKERVLVGDNYTDYVPGVAWNHVKWDTQPNH